MIQELKIKNFLSFKDEVIFSFEATKDKTFEDYQVVQVDRNVRLLRFALVYGANASGKSNLLNAFDFLLAFWFSKTNEIDEKTDAIPFKLDINTIHQPSYFELKFYVNSTKYWYILELDEQRVYLEKLYFYTSVQPTLLFERTLENNTSVIQFNPAVVKVSNTAKEEICLKCLTNMSFFAARNQVNVNLPEIDKAINWMKNNFMPIIEPSTKMFDYAEHQILSNKNLKDYLLNFVHHADFNISDIDTHIVKEDIPQNVINFILHNEDLPDAEKERIRKEKNIKINKTTFEHSVKNERGAEKYSLESKLQSKGTKRIFGLEAAIYEQIKKNTFLAIDEMECSLHPDLVEFILKKFLEEKNNRSQLLITTHYDPLLNEIDDLFRKDAVWFTEKDETGHSNLYSLVEFKGLNRMSSFQRVYRNGVFGAIPNIKE
ncbi:MAG: hypothetical protein BWY27_01215 [Bacteroidetes bacterium ADurb.Bin234]|nr:MAG: hypothetical protein BWY27_01215 [Bacteroidetes bacterium ADurb.Bin234]